jgi:hypothetical protein
MPHDGRCASAGEPFGAVAHGGNEHDRAASPTHCLPHAQLPITYYQCPIPIAQSPLPRFI